MRHRSSLTGTTQPDEIADDVTAAPGPRARAGHGRRARDHRFAVQEAVELISDFQARVAERR
jgi:hypothetical protein